MLSLPYSLHYFFYKNIGGRTYQSIFNGQMIDLIEFFAVSMRIFSTSFRSHLINRAGIILIKKKNKEDFVKPCHYPHLHGEIFVQNQRVSFADAWQFYQYPSRYRAVLWFYSSWHS